MTQPRKATWLTTLLKRNGREVSFNPDKIECVIATAGQATGEFDPQQAQALAKHVVGRLLERVCLDIERVQDLVGQMLMEIGHYPTVRAYMVYRERHDRLRRERKTLVDVAASMNEYLSREGWRVCANANQGYSLGRLVPNAFGKATTDYWLDEVCDTDITIAHRDADLHIHDLDTPTDYCVGWSLRTLLNEGLDGIPGRVKASPPKHLGNVLGQMVNFLGTLQNEWAGAQAFSSFDIYLAPYTRRDRLDYVSVRQVLQKFICSLNVPSHWGTQTPFINLTLDWVYPSDLRDQVPRIGGEEMPFVYDELQAEMDLINHTYIEVMQTGDAHGRMLTFPIPTYNITHDFPWDNDNATRLFEVTACYGLPCFQSLLNSDMQPNQTRSMCYCLQPDVRKLLKRGNSLFNPTEQTSSLDVVTISCTCLDYRHHGDATGLYCQLGYLLGLAFVNLELKHRVIQQHMGAGPYPYTRRYLGTLRDHFSTIGVNDLHEMVRSFSDDREGLHSEARCEMALTLPDHARVWLVAFREDSGHLYNLETIPAEGTTYRFAREDCKHYPRTLQAGTPETPYYTNSPQLPVGFTDDPLEALELQDALQCKYTGGAVPYPYTAERISSTGACEILVCTALSRFRLPYLTVTPTFLICLRYGYLADEYESCPKCDEELLQRSTPKSCRGGRGG